MSGKNVYVDRLMWSLYLACCLAGLAGGLWFEVWTGRGSAMIPPPSLAGVAMGQGAFFWLALPVLLLRRQQNHRPVELLSAVMTTLLWLAASAPMVMLAGWLGDATWLDGVRAELAVAATAVVGWLGGLLLARAAWRGGLLGGLLVTGLALPMGWYIALDLFAVQAGWLWTLWPGGMILAASGVRQGVLLPQPIRAWLVWPVVTTGVWLITRRPAGR